MDAIPLALDGYLDAIPSPGATHGTARFRLIASPTDDVADESIWVCATRDPRIAHALLTEIHPGDLLRVTGYLLLPDGTASTARLSVDTLEVLATAPLQELHDMVLDRYGPYAVVYDADRDHVPVFTTAGTWVGEAANPDAIGDLIAAFESDGPPPSAP
ncbi:hypothetical protein DVA86_20450 [Streptomyces armeniacus]|uniref:Uncharacterized protein n=1 Tax=Streptomyces armeniacus TaxID=83291 RepID=A0A345XSQ0_9ACTN|nr:hypothetical protein [Streptomyces armeniacus]AXK34666.1 hypothetical protein DVA86_20450 [Streptomyces armeniacus]